MKRLLVNLSEAEHGLLKTLSAKTGASMSEIVRARLFGVRVRVPVEGEGEGSAVEQVAPSHPEPVPRRLSVPGLREAVKAVESRTARPAAPCAHSKIRLTNGGARFCDDCKTVVPAR